MVASRVAELDIGLWDIALRGQRHGVSLVAIVAWGDLVGIVRDMNVWIHLFALVRDVTCGPLCEFLKRAMAAKAGFGVRLFSRRRDRSFLLRNHTTGHGNRGQKYRQGQATQ